MRGRASAFFRPIPIDSPVHRLAAETKVTAGIVISIGLVFNTEWSHIGVAAALALFAFTAARLPRSILPKVPLILRFALIGGMMGSAFSGEEPNIGALSIGGILDYARLIAIGVIMILWVGILSWTTGVTAIGFALRRMIAPLGRLGLPVDEIGSVIALAVRSLPLVADEVDIVNESVASRPSAVDHQGRPLREALSFIGDTSSAVVVGAHRRARDLAMALVSRGSTSAPEPPRQRLTPRDIAIIVAAFGLCIAAFIIPGVPSNID